MATEYDDVVAQNERQAAADDFVHRLQGRCAFESVLDVACGTGLFALAALDAGAARVTGIDVSESMLAEAWKRVQSQNSTVEGIDFLELSMDDLSPLASDSFDAVLCMGNSLPHLTDHRQLDRAVSEFARVLRPDGLLVLQILNFERILQRKERIVGVTSNGRIEHIRFYDFLSDQLRFNHLRIDWHRSTPETRLESTLLKPLNRIELEGHLVRYGLTRTELFGDLEWNPFKAVSSPCLVAVSGFERRA